MAQVIDTLRAEDYFITDPDGTVSTAGPEISGNEALAFHLVAAEIVGGAYADLMPTVYAEQFAPYWISKSSQSTWLQSRWNSGPYHGALTCTRPNSLT